MDHTVAQITSKKTGRIVTVATEDLTGRTTLTLLS